ncbi:M56 family metallopeptidase [Phaeacidiphilus oryzae]|uniref:M56 family metallopeptidase n=1 Tax=Phaeacidiphilus oryzae TaxID=348818 RepID=UPI00068C7410|nr:M56 family metallopeptidase [Phaeacidiphilus oryzae]
MLLAVYVPLATSVVLGLVAAPLARRMMPRAAAWTLGCAGPVAAGGWVGALTLLAVNGFGRLHAIAVLGHWSARALRAADPIGAVVADAGVVLLALTVLAVSVAAWWRARSLLAAYRECRRLPGGGELTVIDDARLEAFTLAGFPGRMVVSTGMLSALNEDERRALLAHERSHLHHRHFLFLLAVQLAATACPLLLPLAREGAFVLERWADEDAAEHVGDRGVTARAVARAAVARKQAGTGCGVGAGRGPAAVMTADGGPVLRRVRALLAPAPRPHRAPLAAFAVLLLVCWACLAGAAQDTQRLFVVAKIAKYAHTAEPIRAPAISRNASGRAPSPGVAGTSGG